MRVVERDYQSQTRIGVSTREEPRPRSKRKTKKPQSPNPNMYHDSILPLNALTMQRYAMLQNAGPLVS
jgi:hypothetical protein